MGVPHAETRTRGCASLPHPHPLPAGEGGSDAEGRGDGDAFGHFVLLKLAAFERAEIVGIELEPFAIRPTVSEPSVPITLYPRRVVSLNCVNQLDGFRKSY